MGDLYQDLDPVVKARYALAQTPDFVIDFILDETLTPAIKKWGVEKVRVIDPSCGSGHFLLAMFRRLVEGMVQKFPKQKFREIVHDCLNRVVGIDLNDYACSLARARLFMTAVEYVSGKNLEGGWGFHPQVYWADALEQVEREKIPQEQQLDMFKETKPETLVTLTRPEVSKVLRPLIKEGFHVIVGNPPYITEKNTAAKKYHREKVGKDRRYISATGKYSLGVPFTERFFQLGVKKGYVGMITANSFMKRQFGKSLIERVLPQYELTKVVDTSGAYIPHHGTPTVLIFGNCQAARRKKVLLVMGKRGEPAVPKIPEKGFVWSSIVEGHGTIKFENEFISVSKVDRKRLGKHPWSLQGGGASELKTVIETSSVENLNTIATSIGFASFTGTDDIYIFEKGVVNTFQLSKTIFKSMVLGESVRNWSIDEKIVALVPYDSSGFPLKPDSDENWLQFLWYYKTSLEGVVSFGGKTRKEENGNWWEWYRWVQKKYQTPLSITFAEVETHNHFVLDRGGKVFKQTAPVVKLPPNATEKDHLCLLGQLNSSVACFWLKQVCYAKGGDKKGKGRTTKQEWMAIFQHDSTKLKSFPLIATSHKTLDLFSALLDQTAKSRTRATVADVITKTVSKSSKALLAALKKRRKEDLDQLFKLVVLQEELDWLCYKLYGIEDFITVQAPKDLSGLVPGLRPFEITLAQKDQESRKAIAKGETPINPTTEWFTRHGWEPHITSDNIADKNYQKLVKSRLKLTEKNKNLKLLEQPKYKRRWKKPDYEAEEKEALLEWLCDALEDWSEKQDEPWSVSSAAADLQSDKNIQAVAEVFTGQSDFDLESIFAKIVATNSVPNIKVHRYKPTGLAKRKAWEHTWEMQHREDAGEKVTPPVPPKYTQADFLKPAYYKLRNKLDVPKERFIAFTEIPTSETFKNSLYGWAGWTPKKRGAVLLELDEQLEDNDVDLEKRYGLLYGAWFLLPWVAWESKEAAEEYGSIITELVGESGITEEMLVGWASKHPAPGTKRKKVKK